jgi:cytochrome c-type biogenesis protein CcmH
MNTFLLIAALLVAAVLLPLVYPLIRHRAALSPPAWPVAAVAIVVICGGAALLYPVWSNWKWSVPEPAADSPAAMVGRLARRLETQPDDLPGWLLLGRSYAVIEQYPLSARAYQRADTLAKGQSAEALIGLGDALVNGGQSDLAGRAGRLFEQALALDPNSVKALFYSAIAAAERNELPVARARFVRLLDGNPPPDVRKVIEQQVRALDGMAALASNSQTPAAAEASGVAPASAAAPSTSGPAKATAVVAVPLRITLTASVAPKASPGAPLFVLARIPGQRGPPLAARRLDARFPQEVELLSSDAMIAGSGFTLGQEIEIEARIANGGSAISRSGDPFGSVRVKAGMAQRTTIEINQLKP